MDGLCPPDAMRHLAAKLGGDVELRTFPSCGHSPYYEEPAIFNRTLLGFFRAHPI